MGLRSKYRVCSTIRSSRHSQDPDLSKVLLGHPAVIKILASSSNF